MIYTVTFNPAIDYVMEIDDFIVNSTNRSKKEKVLFGGKGINVSCVLKELGEKSVALGFVAGFTGRELEKELSDKGVITDFVYLDKGLTRINVKLKGEGITEINANGPEITEKAIEELFLKLKSLKCGDTLVLAGSIPSSLPQDIYEQILSSVANEKIKAVVDAEGELLLKTLKYKPFLIKPNEDELSAISGKKLESEEEIITFAKTLQEKGAVNVLVSRGEKGAILIAGDGNVYKADAHKIKAVNTVGAGDSMVAGYLAGIKDGYDYALQLGIAAGGATSKVNGLATAKEIYELIK